MRSGEKKDFKPEKLKVGEFAVLTDTGEVYVKTSEETVKGLATLNQSEKLEQMPTYLEIGAAAESHEHSANDITSGTLPISRGGTGARSSSAALTNLGAAKSVHEHSASEIASGTLPVERGGTGGTTANAALTNLGAVPKTRTINFKALSSNIELNCADVGAAEKNHVHSFSELKDKPTTVAGHGITDILSNDHTHTFESITEKPTTLLGYGITNAVLTTRTINSKVLSSNITLTAPNVEAEPYETKSSADFNEMKMPGLYTIRSSTTNAPTSGSYHSLIVNKSDNSDYVQQLAIKESTTEMYVRYLSGSTWSAWKKFYTEGSTMPIANGGTGATTASDAVSNFKTAIVNLVYPIESILMSVKNTNPSNYLGGTWVAWGAGRVPVGVNTSDSSFSTVEKTGGKKTHTLTSSEMPKHAHYTGVYTGNGSASHFAATGGDSLYSNTDTG